MKKIYVLLFTILTTSLSYGQIIITEIADPNNNSQARYLELYNAGGSAVDFTEGTGWQIDKYRNADVPLDSSLDLTGTIAAGGFYIIAYDFTPGEFVAVYGFAPDQLDNVENGVIGSNGDDDLFLVNGSDIIVDAWGDAVPGVSNSDNTGTCAEYEDGRAERKGSVTGPNATWDEAEWSVWADSTVGGCTTHVNSPRTAPADFDPGSWIGVAGTCALSLSTATITCNSNTAGDDNDSVTINIPYTGSDATVTSVTTTSGGVVGGDDPAAVTDGTITITGLSEGSAWDITINGGNCDGTTDSGTVNSAQCDPSPLVINELLYDPAADPNGDANGDGTRHFADDEFVEIYNISASPVDMEGFTLSDDFGVRHTFTSTILAANSFITVFGGGTPTGISGMTQIADDGQLGLSNGGDLMSLKNDSGIELDLVSYTGGVSDDQSYAREPDFTGAFLGHQSHANSREFSPGESNDTVLSIGLNEIENFAVYPNPVTSGFFTINSANRISKSVQVYDLLGKQVFNKTIQNNERIDVTNLNAGIYILKVEEEGKLATRKLIIE